MRTAVNREAIQLLVEAQSADRLNDLSVPSNAEEQRALFLAGDIENPIFLRESLINLSQSNRVRLIDTYRKAIAKEAFSSQGREIFETFADSLDTEITLAEIAREYATAQMDGSDSGDITARFIALRTEIYGELPVDRYKQSVRRVLHKFDGVQFPNDDVLGYLEYIRQHIGSSEALNIDGFLSEPSVTRVENAVKAFGLSPELQHPQGTVTAHQFARAMKSYLHDVLRAPNWNAAVADILEPASTDRFNSVVHFRADTRNNDGARATEVITHEGVHAYRAMLAQELGSAALLIGLPGSQAVEEGLASIFGKVYAGTTRSLDSFDYPVFVAGLMDYEGYDFRAAFEVFWRALAVIRYASANKSFHENAAEESRKLAYKILCSETRLFDQPRYRSLANAAGVRSAWEYLDEHHDDPLALETVLIGKHDPLNPEHKRFLHNLI